MGDLPAYKEISDFREAVRETARALTVDITLNRQARMINDFLLDRVKRNIKVPTKDIPPASWNDFAKPGSTNSPTNRPMVHAAWDWMSEYCGDLLLSNLEEGHVAYDDCYGIVEGFRAVAKGLINGIPRDKGVFDRFSGKQAVIIQSKIQGEIIIGLVDISAEYKNHISFIGRLLFEDSDGKTQSIGGIGACIPHRNGYLLIGYDDQASLFTLEVNSPSYNASSFTSVDAVQTVRDRFGNIIRNECKVTNVEGSGFRRPVRTTWDIYTDWLYGGGDFPSPKL